MFVGHLLTVWRVTPTDAAASVPEVPTASRSTAECWSGVSTHLASGFVGCCRVMPVPFRGNAPGSRR